MVTFYFISYVVVCALVSRARYALVVRDCGICGNAESFWTTQTSVSENRDSRCMWNGLSVVAQGARHPSQVDDLAKRSWKCLVGTELGVATHNIGLHIRLNVLNILPQNNVNGHQSHVPPGVTWNKSLNMNTTLAK